MAEKEATTYIVDVASSMGKKRHGRKVTDLDWAMTYVWDKITSTVASERKTAMLGIVGLRTNQTSNELEDEPIFENISVLQEISQILLPDLKRLQRAIKLSGTDQGDAISAIVIAIQMIAKHCKKLKWRRKIVLVTDGRGSLDADGILDISKKIKEDDIEIVILGVDFDDSDYGFKEEDKDPVKRNNEQTLKALTDDCDGVFGTLAQAIEELGIPRLKTTRPVPLYKDQLTLGEPNLYPETAMCIDVERYPRTMIRKPPSASLFVQRSNLSHGANSAQSSATILGGDEDHKAASFVSDPNGLTTVRNSRTYQIADESAPGRKIDVEREELAKGYEYGRTAVAISQSEENITKLETEAMLGIVGFIPWANYERYMHMSTTNVVIAQKTNSKAVLALSSLIHALFELESFAIGRLVPKKDKAPVLVLLAPSIEVDYECLLDVQLPFAEDIRSYKFPPLDRVVTVSGKILKEHRNLPSDVLSAAMSTYVDSLDLSDFGQDDDGKACEYMTMTDTYSPTLHRIDQVIRWRAIHPTEPFPPVYEILTRYSQPPVGLQKQAKRYLDKLVAVADVKKVPPRLAGRKRNRDPVKPQSGLDVDALLGREKKLKISHENPIPEFKRMLDTAEDPDTIKYAAQQLSKIIENQIRDSFGESNYGQVVEELTVMREELMDLEEPGLFNDFLRHLRRKLLADELKGDRREMWWEIRKNKLGLIEKKVSPRSEVTDDEAKQARDTSTTMQLEHTNICLKFLTTK